MHGGVCTPGPVLTVTLNQAFRIQREQLSEPQAFKCQPPSPIQCCLYRSALTDRRVPPLEPCELCKTIVLITTPLKGCYAEGASKAVCVSSSQTQG